MKRISGQNIWALIIGIDQYKSDSIARLRGCRADADDFKCYLTDSLGVPEGNIFQLQDKRATRELIIRSFEEHFLSNARIDEKSTAIFYFAGHGTRNAHHVAGQPGGRHVETICPYDYGYADPKNFVHGIPQTTLHALLSQAKQTGCDVVSRILGVHIFDNYCGY